MRRVVSVYRWSAVGIARGLSLLARPDALYLFGSYRALTKTIKKGYAAFSAGDAETLFSLVGDDIEWIQPGNSAISGAYRGKAEFGQLLGRMAEKSVTTSPYRFFADGDMVVVLTEVSVAGETAEEADVHTFRDGKVVKTQVIGDTALLERVWGARP